MKLKNSYFFFFTLVVIFVLSLIPDNFENKAKEAITYILLAVIHFPILLRDFKKRSGTKNTVIIITYGFAILVSTAELFFPFSRIASWFSFASSCIFIMSLLIAFGNDR